LQRDVAAAFAYHANDLAAWQNDVHGYIPIPEQRYYEKIWLDQ